jgi:hypothetical protein
MCSRLRHPANRSLPKTTRGGLLLRLDLTLPLRLSHPTACLSSGPFWLIKLTAITTCATAVDFLAVKLGPSLTATLLLMRVILIGALVLEFRQRRYLPWSSWLTILVMSAFGIGAGDVVAEHQVSGVPEQTSCQNQSGSRQSRSHFNSHKLATVMSTLRGLETRPSKGKTVQIGPMMMPRTTSDSI